MFFTSQRIRLIQPFEQGNGCRQQRDKVDAALPSERLPFQALRFAVPIAADIEMQAHMRMGIHVLDATPRDSASEYPHARFFG